GAVCRHIHAQGTAHSVRQILGVLALAKKHGVAVVEEAAKAALEIGVPTYRFLRQYVERRPPLPLTLPPGDPLIRQLTLYRDLIDKKTGGSECRSSTSIVRSANSGSRAWPTSSRHACATRKRNGCPHSISWPRSSPTNSADAKTGCWPAGTSWPPSAIPIARSRISISISTRK